MALVRASYVDRMRDPGIAWELDLSILGRAGVAVTKPLPPLSARTCPELFAAPGSHLTL
jgi:hypothetical protein